MKKLKWNPVVFFENMMMLLGTLVTLLFVASYIEAISINLGVHSGLSWWNMFNVYSLIKM